MSPGPVAPAPSPGQPVCDLPTPLSALRREGEERDPGRRAEREDEVDDRRRRRRIRCPKCGWEPRRWDLWGCLCGNAFHTFDTAGRCPACGEQWDHTQCLRCGQWSPHQAWYERP